MTGQIRLSFLVIICFSLLSLSSFSQIRTPDTIQANQYLDLAARFESSNLTDSAIYYAGKAQVLNIRYFGEKSTRNANVLHLLGILYFSKNQYERALEYNLQALKLRQEILGENHTDLAKSYYNIGLVYKNKKEYEKALDYSFRALQIYKELSGENNPDVAGAYFNIGLIYFAEGKYEKTLEYYFKVLEISKVLYGENHADVAWSYYYIGLVYNNMGDTDKALDYNLRALQIRKELPGERDLDVATSYNDIGIIYYVKAEYDKALEYCLSALQIRRKLLGENDLDVAQGYNILGNIYRVTGEYKKALDSYVKVLQICKDLFGENNEPVATAYMNIGNVYYSKGEYDRGLEYYFNSLQISKEIKGENNSDVSECYNNIGVIYDSKGEYDKALEYHFKALQMRKELSGEKSPDVADSYGNLGIVYSNKKEYGKALEYCFRALEIKKEINGEQNSDVASIYNNIGNLYYGNYRYPDALEYYLKSLQIRQKIFGANHPDVALSYSNAGACYKKQKNNDKAMEYNLLALRMRREILGDKHPDVASSYINLGIIFSDKGENRKALEYYQRATSSCIFDFNDTSDICKVPVIKSDLNWEYLLQALYLKANVLSDNRKKVEGLDFNERKKAALKHYQVCDTLIDIARKNINTQSDKLTLGVKAGYVYKGAIALLTSPQHYDYNIVGRIPDKDVEMAFYFSEKNKSSVLLEALAGQEAQKFAGIPDSLLKRASRLKLEIAFYSKQIAESEKSDNAKASLARDRLFRSNRSYDSLILVFEKQYPEYHNLKYNNKPATVKEIQNLLDNKTAMISFFAGDSIITRFTLTKTSLDIHNSPMMRNLKDSIVLFRYGLTKINPKMQKCYRRLGYDLYQQLFAGGGVKGKQIENMIIIPDGELALLPFESLLTEKFTGDINSYKDYPYLIKKCNISYSYSANIFHLTFSKPDLSAPENSKLNDWIAFAPVFDNTKEQNAIMSTRELQRQLGNLETDSALTNRSLFDYNNIAALPATETEAKSIFTIFDDNRMKAKVLLHNNANEQFIKSGELSKYKAIHFATHGFINSQKPELSGLMLAQDTSGGEDGILYSGEIYNLKLNADLVILSACETGLGKIQRGEGIIGLTRALLYAGAKNIIVSLWEVADESTSALMIGFYKSKLSRKEHLSNSEALRSAKLKMIGEGKYAHPLYWSPFILIGK